jgi:hypothetical protein
VLEDVLNPTLPLKLVSVNERLQKLDSTLSFSDQDVSTGQLGKLVNSIENPFTFDISYSNNPVDLKKMLSIPSNTMGKISKHPVNDDNNTAIDIVDTIIPPNKTQLPVFLRKTLKDFSIYEPELEYDTNWIYMFMLVVNNHVTNQVLTIDQFKEIVKKRVKDGLHDNTLFQAMEQNPFIKHAFKSTEISTKLILEASQALAYGPSEAELIVMSKLTNVNIIIVSRKVKDIASPDQVKCLGKIVGDSYVLLQQHHNRTRHIHCYFPIVKNDTKFIFKLRDFNPEFAECLKHKCMKMTLKNAMKMSELEKMSEKCPSSVKV